MAEDSPYSGRRRPERRRTARQQVAVAIENRAAPPTGDPQGQGRTAPRVVASGRGALAEQILQIAFDRGIKVRNDADLAEILATVEVETEIPLEALAAVAEILSYVYRTQSKTTAPNMTAPNVMAAETAGENGA